MMTKNKTIILKVLVIALAILIPVIGMIVYMMSQGLTFDQIYIPSSYWNDELFYYKQIEGVIKYGHPQGCFGYMESQALYGNFAAWNFTNILPFALVGKIFGWNPYTPIWFNMFIWIVALILFALLIKPSLIQQLYIMGFFVAYSIFDRYMFSVTPEVTVAAFLFICMIFAYSYYKNDKLRYLVLCNVFLLYPVIMQGYCAIFGIIIVAILLKKKRYLSLLVQILLVIAAVVVFVEIHKYFAAPAFSEIFTLESLTSPKLFFGKIITGWSETLGFIKLAYQGQSMRGVWYLIYFLLGVLIIAFLIEKRNLISLSILITYIGLIMSMWVLNSAAEGSRKLMASTMIGFIFILYFLRFDITKIAVIIITGVVVWSSNDVFYINLPQKNEELAARIESHNLDELMPISEDCWDNTVIWPLSTGHNEFYNLPAGFGISCCYDDYIYNNFDDVKSKYIAVQEGNDLDIFLQDRNCEKIATEGSVNIYSLR